MEDNNFKLDNFFGATTLTQGAKLYEYIHQNLFIVKDTGITRRTMNHWDKEALLLRKAGEKEWRRFNFVEFVWLKLMDELRKFAVPLEIVRNLKENFFTPIPLKKYLEVIKDDILNNPQIINSHLPKGEKEAVLDFLRKDEYKQMDESDTITLLALLISDTVAGKTPISIVVYENGDFLPYYETRVDLYPDEARERMMYETHIKVSITNIIKEFLASETSVFALPKLHILQPNEQRLLEIISSGDYETVSVHFKNKKMKHLELHKKEDVKRRIVDILQDNQYQDIIIKSHKGLVTTIQNTVKVILD